MGKGYQDWVRDIGSQPTRHSLNGTRHSGQTIVYKLLTVFLWYRNHHVMSLLEGGHDDLFGPDECIDDHVESKYFDNETVSRQVGGRMMV